MQFKFSDIISLDERSVSLFRIMLGISILYNLIFIKFSYTTQVWGSNPLIPADIMKYMNGADSFSIFDYIRSDGFAYAWIIVSVISAILYIAGIYSKINSWILLLLFFNLIQACQRYLGGFEKYTIILLFWSCFLPLDNYFSIVKPKNKYKPDKRIIAVILVQLSLIYFSTGLAKYGVTWFNGDAVKIICSDVFTSRGLAYFIAKHEWIYKPLTYGTLIAEYGFPLLLFFPYKNSIFRTLAVIFLIGFHGSIFLVSDVGNFSLTGIAAAVLLIPSFYWDKFKVGKDEFIIEKKIPRVIYNVISILICLSIYHIVTKNLRFLTGYSIVKKTVVAEPLVRLLDKIELKTPIDETIFFQDWKMYAPNPIKELGWISIEYIGDDGLHYDAFSQNIINQQVHQKYYFPKGMEKLLMIYGKILHDKKKPFARVFLKYWYFDALKKMKVKEQDYNRYFLAQYSSTYFYNDDGKFCISEVRKTLFLTEAIRNINTEIKR